MPAIRYRIHNVCAVVLAHLPIDGRGPFDDVAEVRTSGGEFARLDFRGFFCVHALPFMGDGSYCKILCSDVTDGDGFANTWRPVGKGEYALGWLRSGQGRPVVYGIVGRDGYPIVVHADGTFTDSSIRDYVRSCREQEQRLLGDSAA